MKENKKSVLTRRASSHCKTSKEKQEDFIMLPTVDFCFKELMQNDNIRKNIIAALLNVPSSEVENTELMKIYWKHQLTRSIRENYWRSLVYSRLPVVSPHKAKSILAYNHFLNAKECYRRIVFFDMNNVMVKHNEKMSVWNNSWEQQEARENPIFSCLLLFNVLAIERSQDF